MIYLVTLQQQLFELPDITNISLRQALEMSASWDMIQYDSETSGRDAHLCKVLCIQLGDIEGNNQIVIDATTIDIIAFKEILESHYLIGHNLKTKFQL